jgi:hypothetical protein
MNTKKVVFNKLFSKEAQKAQKLSKKRKVAFSVVQNAQTEYDALQDLEGELYSATEMLAEFHDKYIEARNILDSIVMDLSLTSLGDTVSTLSSALSQIEDSSATLGVEPSEVFDSYDDARELISNVLSVYDSFISEWRLDMVQSTTSFADRLTYIK